MPGCDHACTSKRLAVAENPVTVWIVSAVTRAFLDRLTAAGLDVPNALADPLAAALASARIVDCPEPESGLGGYLADRLIELADGGDLRDALAQLSVGELYLAWACAQGSNAAITAFERSYFGAARAALGRMKLDTSTIDEIVQTVRERLFVGGSENGPRVLAVAGRGDLGTFVRVTAVRIALNLNRDVKRLVPDDSAVIAALTPTPSPATEVIAERERAELARAIETALRELDARQRNVLRLHFSHHLNVDEIGAIYHVSRATAARWLVQIREAIEQGTRRDLKTRLVLEASSIDSMLRMFQSNLEISFERLLASSM
jgi:RNA polymerase sigma-70 factor (ECF subfamily)